MRALMLSLLLFLPACSQAAEPAPAPVAQASVHPESGLEVIPLTVTTADGKSHALRVEVARSGQEQARGLMFRTQMGADEGMLFPYDQPRVLSFWMKNTVLSLDLVFIGPDRRVINVADHAVPYSEAAITSDAPGIAVLELNAGRAAQLGITSGAKVDW
ncbi:MAG TPA: DUF192 domain-containing protein [Croceibacterium sp.]|nr:DUF192 domain-containing protein [Croceibacterium sp.]